jgi:hypothetical protein
MRKIVCLSAAIPALVAPIFFVYAQGAPRTFSLPVPYVSEAPGNSWYGSWKNACEEASIAMLQYYYMGKKTETVAQSKVFMQALFVKERKLWGSDANSDTKQTLQLIDSYSDFSGRIAEAPSIGDIRAELDAGRPVILPLDGFLLANKHIPFLASGSGYHMFVVIGYDEAAQQFIVNDTGDNVDGPGHRYSYATIMSAMRDYDNADQKTDGPARAIFTYPKLAKSASSHRIYYLHDGVKQYVSHPLVFGQRGWSWSWVNVVSADFLAGFKDGAVINQK